MAQQVAWTASHISSRGRFAVLEFMLQSLAANQIPVRQISLSTEPELLAETEEFVKALQEEHKDVEIILQPKKMRQFQHLAFLCHNFRGREDDMILFMDDDDLLLENNIPWQEYDVVQSLQYIPVETCEEDGTFNADLAKVLALRQKWEKSWQKEADFSGYMARYSIVKQYFAQRQKKEIGEDRWSRLRVSLATMEDIGFMKYLDNYPGKKYIPKEVPHVFHRLWEDKTAGAKTSTWRSDAGL